MATLIDKVIGHKLQKDRLQAAIKNGRLSSTLLFVGPSGIGKKTLALALAQCLVCEKSNEGHACGVCPSCHRLEKNQSEHCLLIRPEGISIKIDQTRELIQFLSLRSMAKNKVVIIDQAQSLTAQAANALLKSLEEPPDNCYIILMVPSFSSVLPTLSSRAQVIRFSPLTKEELKTVVKASGWVLESAQGSVEAVHQLQEPEILELRKKAFSTWETLLDGNFFKAFGDIKESVKEKKQSLLVCKFWQQLLRDSWLSKENVGSSIHQDHRHLIKKLSGESHKTLEALSLRVFGLEKDILANADRTLAFENYFYQAKRDISGQQ